MLAETMRSIEHESGTIVEYFFIIRDWLSVCKGVLYTNESILRLHEKVLSAFIIALIADVLTIKNCIKKK